MLIRLWFRKKKREFTTNEKTEDKRVKLENWKLKIHAKRFLFWCIERWIEKILNLKGGEKKTKKLYLQIYQILLTVKKGNLSLLQSLISRKNLSINVNLLIASFFQQITRREWEFQKIVRDCSLARWRSIGVSREFASTCRLLCVSLISRLRAILEQQRIMVAVVRVATAIANLPTWERRDSLYLRFCGARNQFKTCMPTERDRLERWMPR